MNSCANSAHNSGLKKKEKEKTQKFELYDYNIIVEVGQDIDHLFVLDRVGAVSISL